MNILKLVISVIRFLMIAMRCNMPIMIRPKGTPKKIAYKILGIPANMQNRHTKEQDAIKKRLLFEQTARAR